MALSGIKHIDVGAELSKTEWEDEANHEIVSGSAFPTIPAPVDKQLFYRTDLHGLYIYNGSAWISTDVTTHNALALSHLTHLNNNLFSGYGAETIAGLRFLTKVPSLTAISDPLSMLDVSNWYGASGAYRQADADSSSTKIEDDDAAFPASILRTIVKWASNAAGTLNTGIGTITAVDSDTLTIEKNSEANFAASYYYWIKHSELIIPVTGLYLVTGQISYLPAEVNKIFHVQIWSYAGTSAPTQLRAFCMATPISDYIIPAGSWIIPFTANDHVFSIANHTGTLGTPTLYYTSSVHNPLSIFLLKQTA